MDQMRHPLFLAGFVKAGSHTGQVGPWAPYIHIELTQRQGKTQVEHIISVRLSGWSFLQATIAAYSILSTHSTPYNKRTGPKRYIPQNNGTLSSFHKRMFGGVGAGCMSWTACRVTGTPAFSSRALSSSSSLAFLPGASGYNFSCKHKVHSNQQTLKMLSELDFDPCKK